MNTISVELVPRNHDGLIKDLQIVKKFQDVDEINIPDLISCPIRSWEAAKVASEHYPHVIAHIRAIDIDPVNPELFFEKLRIFNLKKILVISGDIPQTYGRQIYPTTALQVIKWCKEYLPGTFVYAAIDPYRSGMRDELSYAREKIDAGADGFFTQPFFDLDLMNVWADALTEQEIYWGIAPVTSIKSKEGYWETKNKVIFPRKWDLSLTSNQDFANEVIWWINSSPNWNVYLMPIKIDIGEYLSGIFR
ncbi:MAG: methylenetetrahydrofolate reductase [Candidatus Paceibacterota bacterium]